MDSKDCVFPVENAQTFAAGLSKREYFAAMALQGILASEGDGEYQPHVAGERAVKFADALLGAL